MPASSAPAKPAPSDVRSCRSSRALLKRGARHDPVDHVAETAAGGAQVFDDGFHGGAVGDAGLAGDGVGDGAANSGVVVKSTRCPRRYEILSCFLGM